MNEEAHAVAAVEVVGPLVAAFATAPNTIFQVLVTRNVISDGEAKALVETMADTLRHERAVEPALPRLALLRFLPRVVLRIHIVQSPRAGAVQLDDGVLVR